MQVIAAEAQEEIIERARTLRGAIHTDEEAFPEEESAAAEIPPEVPRLDLKSWQRAVGLALFFTVLVLAAFFYLIQSARRLNFQEQQATAGKAAPTATAGKPTTASVPAPPVSLTPTLRLYTDLIPGTVVLDDEPPHVLVADAGDDCRAQPQPRREPREEGARCRERSGPAAPLAPDAPECSGLEPVW